MKLSILHATSLMVARLFDLLQQAPSKINGQREFRAWRQGHGNEWMRQQIGVLWLTTNSA